MEIVFLFVGIVVGVVVAYAVSSGKRQSSVRLNEKNKFLQLAIDEKVEKISALEEKLEEQNDQITEFASKLSVSEYEVKTKDAMKEEMLKEFKLISGKILEGSSKDIVNQNSQELEKVIAPFKTKVGDLEKKIADCYDKELRDKISLKEEMKKLTELNFKLSQDAENLTSALKGSNKMQGNWGEMILESILEKSGLQKGIEYDVQEASENSDGDRIHPDVVVYLPEGKHVIIDAKISLKAYEEFANSDDEEKKEKYLKSHIKSIKTHISELSDKNYQTSIKHNTLDFILMFVPIEPSYLLAIQNDADLFWNAWEKKILIVSPTTLHSTLKIIVALWRQEKQGKNAKEIARLSGALYDKFVNFLEDMQKIGRSLRTADKSYTDAMQKLSTGRGNLVSRLENIKSLGAKASKKLPETLIEEDEVA